MKPGTLRELKMAQDAQEKHGLKDFIVPMKIDEFPFRSMQDTIQDLNMVRFDGTWATGLRQLLALLEREGAPKSESANVSAVMDWYARSIDSQRQAVVSNDKYLSNWFRLRLPKRLYSRQFSDCGFVKGGVALSIRGHGSLRGRACCPPHNGVRG